MRQTPLPLKLVINFVAYIGYTILLSVIFSFSFPVILKLMGKELYNPTDPIFTKIQISIAIIVFLVTLVFRKYFYLSLRKDNDLSEIKAEEKKEEQEKQIEMDWLNFDNKIEQTKTEKTTKKENEYVFKMDDEEDDDLKIFVDKEIKR